MIINTSWMFFSLFCFVSSLFFLLLHPKMKIYRKRIYILLVLLSITFEGIAQGSGNPPPPMPPPPVGLPIDAGVFAFIAAVFGVFYASKKIKN